MEIKSVQDIIGFIAGNTEVQGVLGQLMQDDRLKNVLKKYNVTVDPQLMVKMFTMLGDSKVAGMASAAAGAAGSLLGDKKPDLSSVANAAGSLLGDKKPDLSSVANAAGSLLGDKKPDLAGMAGSLLGGMKK